jgi:hypothetical protein
LEIDDSTSGLGVEATAQGLENRIHANCSAHANKLARIDAAKNLCPNQERESGRQSGLKPKAVRIRDADFLGIYRVPRFPIEGPDSNVSDLIQ